MSDKLVVYGFKGLSPAPYVDPKPYPWRIWELDPDKAVPPAAPETHELIPSKELRRFEDDPGRKVLG